MTLSANFKLGFTFSCNYKSPLHIHKLEFLMSFHSQVLQRARHRRTTWNESSFGILLHNLSQITQIIVSAWYCSGVAICYSSNVLWLDTPCSCLEENLPVIWIISDIWIEAKKNQIVLVILELAHACLSGGVKYHLCKLYICTTVDCLMFNSCANLAWLVIRY